MNDIATELAHDGAVEDGRIEEARQRTITYAEGFRAAGAWLAKHADALAAMGLHRWDVDDYMNVGNVSLEGITIYVYGTRQREMLAELVAQIGGKWEKDYGATQLVFSTTIAGEFKAKFYADREQVCVAKIVGQEEVEVTDLEAVKELPKKKITRDVIEWECAPLLGDAQTSTEGKV